MLTGILPFTSDGRGKERLLHNIQTKDISFPRGVHISKDCESLMLSLLEKDPQQRISWENFFNHPWFGDSNFILKGKASTSSTPQIHSRPNSVSSFYLLLFKNSNSSIYSPIPFFTQQWE